MTRTQIYLSEEETAALEHEARASGRTKSQLIREAIDRVFLSRKDDGKLRRALRRSAGAWRRKEAGKEYVERLRPGRLARIHERAGGR